MSKLKVDEIRSADRSVSSTANITLADDGNTSLGGTLSAGTIGNNVAVEGSFGVTDISSSFTIDSDWNTWFTGKFWHFNGFEKSWRFPLMRDTWNKIKDNYEN